MHPCLLKCQVDTSVSTSRLRAIALKMSELESSCLDYSGKMQKGNFLAVDLGGTNLRVGLVSILTNPSLFKIKTESPLIQEAIESFEQGSMVSLCSFTVPDALKQSSSEELFGFIADAIAAFVHVFNQINPISNINCKLGFTFSFALKQTRPDKGILLNWSKGFNIPDCIGKDVIELLQHEICLRKLPISVMAVINDTVGTLLSHMLDHPNTIISVILGTGTNAAFISKNKMINTEWGDFDQKHEFLPFEFCDKILDSQSSNPGKQAFEKLVGGMYLGEIVRILLNEFWPIPIPYSFKTKFMNLIESYIFTNIVIPQVISKSQRKSF